MILVAKSLAKIYRPVVLWFWSIIVLAVVAVTAILATVYEVRYSIWLLIAGQATKWWLLVFGTLLVATHLKLYVANGITRRAFLAGGALIGGLTAVVWAALVPIGHGVERLVWTMVGTPPAGYPEFSAAEALREFGHYLPGVLACLVSGALIAAGFYRFPWWAGLLLIVPGALPVVAAEGLLGLYAAAESPAPRILPYAGGLAVSLALTLLAAVAIRATVQDVAIRRTAG
jgi:hypothetical protein